VLKDSPHQLLQLILNGDGEAALTLYRATPACSAEDHRWGGYALYLSAKYLHARDALAKAVCLGCEAARIELATVYRHLGDATLARMTLEALDRSVLIPFDRALAEREQGMLLLGEGHLLEAVQTLEQAWTSVQCGPPALQASTALALGLAHGQLGQASRAVHALDSAVAISQGVKRAYPLASRGLYKIYAGDYEGAGQDLQEARTSLVDVPVLGSTLSHNEGVLCRARGQYAEALHCFQTAVTLAGPEGELSFFAELNICAIHTSLGQWHEAAAALARSAQQRTQLRRNLFWRWRAAALSEAQGKTMTWELQDVQQQFLDLGLQREAGWVGLHLTESLFRKDEGKAAQGTLDQVMDITHRLGGPNAMVIELRDLNAVQERLRELHGGYTGLLYTAWGSMSGCVPIRIELITLGASRILVDGRVLPLRLRRSVDVLAYLLERGVATRMQILTDLWPETSPKEAGNYFHQVKNKLEAALPGVTLPYDAATGTYSVRVQGPRLLWDATAVKSLLSADDDDSIWKAITVYAGGFLPSSEIAWVQEARKQLEWSVVKAGLQLIERWSAAGQTSKCLELAQRLREIEPYNEVLAEYLIVATFTLEGHIAACRAFDEVSNQFRLEIGEVPPTLLALENRLNLAS